MHTGGKLEVDQWMIEVLNSILGEYQGEYQIHQHDQKIEAEHENLQSDQNEIPMERRGYADEANGVDKVKLVVSVQMQL